MGIFSGWVLGCLASGRSSDSAFGRLDGCDDMRLAFAIGRRAVRSVGSKFLCLEGSITEGLWIQQVFRETGEGCLE